MPDACHPTGPRQPDAARSVQSANRAGGVGGDVWSPSVLSRTPDPGWRGGEYAGVRGSEIGAVAGEYVDPLVTRLRHVGGDEMGDVAGASGAPSQLALERSRDVLNGGELVGGERLDEELADRP